MQRRHTRALAASAAALTAVTLSACASSDRDSGGDGGAERARPAARSSSARPATRPCSTPRSPATASRFRVARQIFEGLLDQRAGGTELEPALAENWEVSDGRPRVHLQPARGREVPRRHRLQRRRGLLQLRPLVQLQGPRPEPEASGTTRTSSAASPRTRRRRRASTSAARRPTTTTAVITLNQVTSSFPAALALPAFSIQSPTALKKYDADKVSGSEDALDLLRVRHRAPDRHRPVQVRELGPRQRRGHPRPQRRLLGRQGQARQDHLQDDPRRQHPQAGARGRRDRRLRLRRPGRLRAR